MKRYMEVQCAKKKLEQMMLKISVCVVEETQEYECMSEVAYH